jgi:hypothetical protein
MNSLPLDTEIPTLSSEDTRAHTHYSLGLLRILYTVKLIPPLRRMADFRNTTNHGTA